MRSVDCSRLCLLIVLAWVTAPICGQSDPSIPTPPSETDQPAPPVNTDPARDAPAQDDQAFMRVVESENKSVISLEIATRTYRPKSDVGPSISLVGVAHIGERSLYESLQKFLDAQDLVLYESVGPPGTGGPAGEDDHQRATSTSAALRFIAGMIDAYHEAHQKYRIDLKSLTEFAATKDPRLGDWLEASNNDAWNNAIVYRPYEDGSGYELRSLGADGNDGGADAAADLTVAAEESLDIAALSDEDNLQGELAEALDLAFQLDAMNYGAAHWRPSDMAMDELQRAFDDRGLDFQMLGGTLAGTSFPARLIKFMLRSMRALDTMFDGAIADTFKVVLIEILGDERIVEGALGQMDEGFADVLVGERNQVVIDDLKQALTAESAPASVAIFYGAAHMKDMANRLQEQLSYEPASVQWIPAITVDLRQSAVSPRELAQVRMMIRQMMRQQFGRGHAD